MSSEDVVTFGTIGPNQPIPLLVRPVTPGISLVAWSQTHRDAGRELLNAYHAVLFRGFEVQGQLEFESVFDHLVGSKLEYVYRTTPRTQIGKGVYTATEYPARLSIPFHNENAYQRDWPMHLAFFCVKAADQGGETPIADTVKVTERIDQAIKHKFWSKRVMYVRNYRPGVDIPWQTVFQTESREGVETYCQEHEIDCEWKDGDWLQTRQICQAHATHPQTGQSLWFNQAHLFHISSLDPRTQQALLSLYGQEGLPRNAYYGDGTAIEEEVLARIREAYNAESVTFRWEPNDMLLLDNMLISHARAPYKGERRILVSMGNPYSTATKA